MVLTRSQTSSREIIYPLKRTILLIKKDKTQLSSYGLAEFGIKDEQAIIYRIIDLQENEYSHAYLYRSMKRCRVDQTLPLDSFHSYCESQEEAINQILSLFETSFSIMIGGKRIPLYNPLTKKIYFYRMVAYYEDGFLSKIRYDGYELDEEFSVVKYENEFVLFCFHERLSSFPETDLKKYGLDL